MGKILVTGGTGFIGSHVVERLIEEGSSVRVLVRKHCDEKIENKNLDLIKSKGAEIVYGDLRDFKSLKDAVKGIDTVFHLGAISRPMKIPEHVYYDVNVTGTKNLLEACKDIKLKKFVHVSTVSVLGTSPNGKPLKEDEFQFEEQLYGMTKREGELIALQYCFQHKYPLVVIRPCLIYGPRCEVRLVMFKYVKMKLFPMFNKGKAKIEFCHVDNLVDSIMLAYENDKVVGEVFNITDGKAYSMKEILHTIAQSVGVSPPSLSIPVKLGVFLGWVAELGSKLIGIHPPFSRETAKWMSQDVNVYDCSKAKKLLGYKPKVTLKQGIKNTVKWYQENGYL